jgi:hypothetical protein
MSPLLIALGHDFMFGNAGSATGAPWHDVVALVEPAAIMDGLQEVPDGVVILIGHRQIRVVPIHPVSESDGLLSNAVGESQDSLLTSFYEFGDSESFDVSLALEPQFFFDFDLDPQPLTIKAILIALPLPEHRLVTLKEILVRAAPCVVHAHRVISGNRAIKK